MLSSPVCAFSLPESDSLRELSLATGEAGISVLAVSSF